MSAMMALGAMLLSGARSRSPKAAVFSRWAEDPWRRHERPNANAKVLQSVGPESLPWLVKSY